MDCAPKPANWARLCNGTLPSSVVVFPGIGKTTSDDYVDIAKRVIAYYNDNRDAPIGTRLPADAMQVIVKGALRQVHKRQIDDALVVLDEANALAQGNVPPNTGSVDEGADPHFLGIVAALSALIQSGWPQLETRMAEIHEAAAAYPAASTSPRAQALLAEADAIQKKYGPAVAARQKAGDLVEKDPKRNRLLEEKSKHEPQADVLRDKLGLTGFDNGCDKRSVDPVEQQRLAKLCPIAKRIDTLTAGIYAIERHYTDPVYKKYGVDRPKPKR